MPFIPKISAGAWLGIALGSLALAVAIIFIPWLPQSSSIALAIMFFVIALGCFFGATRQYYLDEGYAQAARTPPAPSATPAAPVPQKTGMNYFKQLRAEYVEREKTSLDIEIKKEQLRKLREERAEFVISCIGTSNKLVNEHEGGYIEWHSKRVDVDSLAFALVARFRPVKVKTGTAYVTARMDYHNPNNGECYLSVDYGCWLGEITRAAKFEPADTRELIIGLLDQGSVSAVDDQRDDVVHRRGVTTRALLTEPSGAVRAHVRVYGTIECNDTTSELGDTWFALSVAPPGSKEEPTLTRLDLPPTTQSERRT